MQLVVDLQIFSCQTSSTSTKLLSKTKPSFKKKAWVSTATDPFLADRTKMQRLSIPMLLFYDFKSQIWNLKTIGGDDRSRTCDPLNANQVLSQLSYIPKAVLSSAFRRPAYAGTQNLVAGTGFEPATFGLWAQRATWLLHPALNRMVGLGRLELPTSRLSGVRSNQLSYRPSFKRTLW